MPLMLLLLLLLLLQHNAQNIPLCHTNNERQTNRCVQANRAHRGWESSDWILNRLGRTMKAEAMSCVCAVRVSVLNRKIVPNGTANRCSLCPSCTQNPAIRPLLDMNMVCDLLHTFFPFIRFIVISSRFLAINIYAYASAIESKMELHSLPSAPHIFIRSLFHVLYSLTHIRITTTTVVVHLI